MLKIRCAWRLWRTRQHQFTCNWGEECDAFEAGDIIRMENGIFSYNKNNLVLRAGKRGKIEKLGEFTMEFVETPNLSEIKWVPDPNNSNKTDITKLIVEAIALCSGIEMAHENGWSAVDVESDSLAVVNKLLSPNLDLSVAGYHLQHARSILRSEESFSVKYVSSYCKPSCP
ncbi:BRI1 suppressor 1 (BSU1)-like 1 [Hibiscus syriacus]|uniref:BRI1 suppressor 1 (BSU1)-like 1 n=1 Tax=Hibiscus syriacus TaxID=106335 RepID=A0A6A3AGN6_HIBSY|nr:BRI1 suppressor 1 (BSU1)-like 1 [Hibiscus syriacus]